MISALVAGIDRRRNTSTAIAEPRKITNWTRSIHSTERNPPTKVDRKLATTSTVAAITMPCALTVEVITIAMAIAAR